MPDIEAKLFFVRRVGKDRHASFLFFYFSYLDQKIYLTIGDRGSVKSIFLILEFSGNATKALYTLSLRSISVSAPQITFIERLPSVILKLMLSGEVAVNAEVRVEKSVGNLVKRAIAASPLFGFLANTEGTFNL